MEREILSKMSLCNYSLTCPKYEIDFVKKEQQLTYKLYKSSEELSSFYPIKDSEEFFLKIYLKESSYSKELDILHTILLRYLLFTLMIVLLLSVIFSFYVLYPLRNALNLTQEFVKDILHDYNTPLATMRLNLSLLSVDGKEAKKIQRIERSITTLLSLQENLRHYLFKYQNKIDTFSLHQLLMERVDMIERNYMDIEYVIVIPKEVKIQSNKKALSRILDNLLSNASKYNKKEGTVTIVYDLKSRVLSIHDTGKGIVKPKRVFDRFYKEQAEGIGVGLNIVKKLCEELHIKITIESELHKGTIVTLTF